MRISKRLWLFILRDVLWFGIVIALAELPSPWGAFVAIGAGYLTSGYLQKRIQREDDGPLIGAEKHIYFTCEAILFLILIALILRWISRHAVPAALGIGLFLILSLFGLLCLSFTKLYPRAPKV
jgi:hypothetical protein